MAPAISGCSMPGDLRLQVDPYESAKKLGRAEMRDDVLVILAQWAGVAEDKATEDMLWDIIGKVRDL
jgi:hypothetical protein